MKTQPNIFDFATSELSQDAMFAWLMSWANPQYKDNNPMLNSAAVEFVQLLLNKNEDFYINKIEVGRQWQNIDIWAEINDDILLIIEDKVETSEHSNQLERYRQIAQEEYIGQNVQVFCSYIKIGNEPDAILSKIREKGYHTIERNDILSCMGKYCSSHPLLQDYYNHLNNIEMLTQSYQTKLMKDWDWYAWQGFYKELEKHLLEANWSYVANPAGGFLGMWWHFEETDDAKMYLQFEQSKLCFKITVEEVESRTDIRSKYYTILCDNSIDYPEIKRPERFGTGTYMTIACVNIENLWGESIININDVVKKLHEYEAIVSKCAEVANN